MYLIAQLQKWDYGEHRYKFMIANSKQKTSGSFEGLYEVKDNKGRYICLETFKLIRNKEN